MKKKLLLTFYAFLTILFLFVFINFSNIKRVEHAIHLFDEDEIVYNFQHMDEQFNTTLLVPSTHPISIEKNISHQLVKSFEFRGKTYLTENYLKDTRTEGLMIIKGGKVIFEEYYNGLQTSTRHISWSMSKSFIASLMGIAHDRGLYKLNDPITKYLPQFINTGYDNVRIKDILQMSSGVKFDEDYGDFFSDINRFGRTFSWGSSLEKFAQTLERDREPGTYCHYVSIDTQILGILLEKIMSDNLTSIMQKELWEPMGMQDSAKWIVDNNGLVLALGGLNASLRDYAKLGLLYLNEGKVNEHQIISSSWIKSSTTPDASHLYPGDNINSSHNLGYGFQWWIPENDEGDYFAAGIYNQYIFVQPKLDLIIVKLSANHHYKKQGSITKDIHIALFKGIAQQFSIHPDSELLETHSNNL